MAAKQAISANFMPNRDNDYPNVTAVIFTSPETCVQVTGLLSAANMLAISPTAIYQFTFSMQLATQE
jgi:hypothetical protein